MKVRRAVFGSIVLAGVVVLVLSVAGVFAPRIAAPPTGKDPLEKGPIGTVTPKNDPQVRIELPGAIKTEEFSVEGEGWILTAPRATFDVERQIYRLMDPALTIARESKQGPQRMTAGAALGTYVDTRRQGGSRRIDMSGGVTVHFEGEQTADLRTDALSIELDTEVGHTDGHIELSGRTEEGRHALTGEGVEIRIRERTAKILRDVRAEISGAGGVLTLGADSSETPAPEEPVVTQVACDGPVEISSIDRTVTLNGNVQIAQGEHMLRADTISARFPEEGREPERIMAAGDVRFTMGGAEGACDELVRTAADNQIVVTGDPAVIRQGSSSISAARIVADAATGRILAPTSGTLRLVHREEEDSSPVEVVIRWTDSLRFDRSEQRASFRGGVGFAYRGLQVTCGTLTVRFDEKNQKLLSCLAEGGVKLAGRLDDLVPEKPGRERPEGAVAAEARELAFDPQTRRLVLSGQAHIDYAGQRVVGEHITVDPAAETFAVEGPGSLAVREEGEAQRELRAVWREGMTYSGADGRIVLEREVTLASGARTLQADTVTATLTDDRKLHSFEATGGVMVSDAGEDPERAGMLTANRVIAEPGADGKIRDVTAEGDVVIVQPATDKHPRREIEADNASALLGDGERIVRMAAQGRVRLTEDADADSEGRSLAADRAEAHFGEDERISTFAADGAVVLEQVLEGQPARIAGERLTWDMQSDQGVLVGAPVRFEHGDQRMTGDRVELSQQGHRVRVTAKDRVRATVVVEGDTLDRFLPD